MMIEGVDGHYSKMPKKRHFDLALQSRAPGTNFLQRIDPLYEIPWAESLMTRWSQISYREEVLAINSLGQMYPKVVHRFSPLDISVSRQYNVNGIKVVAFLSQFHQATTLQLSTFLGMSTQHTTKTCLNLFESGLLRRANPEWKDTEAGRAASGAGWVWALNRESESFLDWLDHLSDLEYALLAAGSDLTSGKFTAATSSAVRHNLMVTELALRAMESCPHILGGWGERHCRASNFLRETGHLPVRRNVADLALVTRSGETILFEVSGLSTIDSTPEAALAFQGKARGWATTIARSTVPLKVVFVDISQNPHPSRFRHHVVTGANAVNQHVTKPSLVRKGIGGIYVVDARDWFPMSNCVDESFIPMRAMNALTKKSMNVLDDTPIDPKSDLVVNTLGALQTPHWIGDPVVNLMRTPVL